MVRCTITLLSMIVVTFNSMLHFPVLVLLEVKSLSFTFKPAKPGTVFLKHFSNSEESSYRIFADQSWTPDSLELPLRITPEGLPAKRQWYLHDQIREFCRDDTKDLVCPLPTVPKPAADGLDTVVSEPPLKRPRVAETGPAVDEIDHSEKRQRHWGKCGKPGHTQRTCST